jgi:hypothetical protein
MSGVRYGMVWYGIEGRVRCVGVGVGVGKRYDRRKKIEKGGGELQE